MKPDLKNMMRQLELDVKRSQIKPFYAQFPLFSVYGGDSFVLLTSNEQRLLRSICKSISNRRVLSVFIEKKEVFCGLIPVEYWDVVGEINWKTVGESKMKHDFELEEWLHYCLIDKVFNSPCWPSKVPAVELPEAPKEIIRQILTKNTSNLKQDARSFYRSWCPATMSRDEMDKRLVEADL